MRIFVLERHELLGDVIKSSIIRDSETRQVIFLDRETASNEGGLSVSVSLKKRSEPDKLTWVLDIPVPGKLTWVVDITVNKT